jgi:4-amino-4-deoxy-L-arabinose transferase-like glycosyltransferase
MDALTSPARGNLWDKTTRWMAAHPKWTLALAVVVALGPFLAKPFNMDDPLFVWTARQIHAHPCNPYGFNVNWYGKVQPMFGVTKNPPLASYYLALAAGILGWSETALHFAFLLPALAAILGTYRLARHFCDQPLPAALATLFTPVFLVSSTGVMCDVLMLAFWVWAMVLWVEGMERDAFWPLAGAGLLMALAALTKYFGACLIPLLAVYSLMSKRRFGGWAASLFIPLLALFAYEWATRTLYHRALMTEAAHYASLWSPFLAGLFPGERTAAGLIVLTAGERAAAGFTALTFTGGCLATALFLAPWLWRTRALLAMAGAVALTACALLGTGTLLQPYPLIQDRFRLFMEGQIIFWTLGGVSVLALAVADVWNRRDARSWLLALWVIGTFLFTALFNWTVNGRSILPMAPAVGILLVRRLQPRAGANENNPATGRGRILIAMAAGALLALLVAWSDFLSAAAARQCALQTRERCERGGRTLWFEGHWGFQYYLAELGGQALDLRRSVPADGDFLAVPLNNTNLRPPPAPGNAFYVKGPRFLADMNLYTGAGFYSSADGPLPFVFGHVPPENVIIYSWKSGPPGQP